MNLVKAKGVTAVAVLHDLSLVSEFADKVLLLQNQKMVAYSCPEGVLNDHFISPTFGLRVIPFQHPRANSIIHHFEALKLLINPEEGLYEKNNRFFIFGLPSEYALADKTTYPVCRFKVVEIVLR